MPITSKLKLRSERADAALPRTLWDWLTRPANYRAVHEFRVAAESGDAARLTTLLAPDVAVVVDSGEAEQRPPRVVGGIYDAVTLLLYGMAGKPGATLVERPINGQSGLTVNRGDEVTAAMTLDFTGGLISMVWIRLHPVMLRHWNQI